ncbi:MAG: hypothetical protein ABFD15_06105 [Methanofastidiosum sp.]
MRKETNGNLTSIIIQPGDRISLPINSDSTRYWEVTSVCLGSVQEEDLIGIKTLDKKPGIVGNGMQKATTINEMFVPRHIIELVICNQHTIKMPLDVQMGIAWIEDEKGEIKCPIQD